MHSRCAEWWMQRYLSVTIVAALTIGDGEREELRNDVTTMKDAIGAGVKRTS